MRIKVSSVLVRDQATALDFYTRVLGFKKKQDLPLGEARWLTVVSPEAPEEVELLLEPAANPAAAVYQQALYEQGIPLTAFEVDDVRAEYERLCALEVRFVAGPAAAGDVVIAILDDTCGNLIQLYEV